MLRFGGSQISIRKEDGEYILYVNNQEAGYVKLGSPRGETKTAQRMFPDLIKGTEDVRRIHGIYVEPRYQGLGLGQLLMLRSLDQDNADWYYNSQAEPPAVYAWAALARKGYVEAHWKQLGGIHIVRITPAGRQAYKQALMVKTQNKKGNVNPKSVQFATFDMLKSLGASRRLRLAAQLVLERDEVVNVLRKNGLGPQFIEGLAKIEEKARKLYTQSKQQGSPIQRLKFSLSSTPKPKSRSKYPIVDRLINKVLSR